jgi:hypothetical protein
MTKSRSWANCIPTIHTSSEKRNWGRRQQNGLLQRTSHTICRGLAVEGWVASRAEAAIGLALRLFLRCVTGVAYGTGVCIIEKGEGKREVKGKEGRGAELMWQE